MNEINKEISVRTDYISELANTQQLCQMLLKTPHYTKMGAEGIYAIVETAKSLGIDPRHALMGGLYYVKGKVEMSARMMNALIRSKKHSITRDKKSDDRICILHGKRADNGDTWIESFSIEDATRAGLMGSMVWKTYPKDMLFARALSRLARQLFPDIIGSCYVEGELSLDPNITQTSIEEEVIFVLDEEQYSELLNLLDQLPEYKETILEFLEKKGVTDLHNIPEEMYQKILTKAKQKLDEQGPQ